MNIMWYSEKFDEATWQLFTALSLTLSYIRAMNRNIQHISYIGQRRSKECK